MRRRMLGGALSLLGAGQTLHPRLGSGIESTRVQWQAVEGFTRDRLEVLAEDFAAHGKEALRRCRDEKPDVYIKMVALLMPKVFEVKSPLDGLTDEELDAAVVLLRNSLGTAAIH